MTTRDWKRPLAGALLGGALAVFGPIGTAVGWLSNPVGLYSHPIPFTASVGVFAYAEGRVEARANFERRRDVTVCDNWGDCSTHTETEMLSIVVSRGAGAVTDHDASAAGEVNPVREPSTQSDDHDDAGSLTYFHAGYETCRSDVYDSCTSRWFDLDEHSEVVFDFDVDPRLRSAEFHGVVAGQRFDVLWTSVGPLTPEGEVDRSNGGGASPRWGLRNGGEARLRRSATASAAVPGLADPFGNDDATGGRIQYAATAQARTEGGAPVEAPCPIEPARPICRL